LLPKPIAGGSLAFLNGYLYIMGGYSGGYLNDVYFTKLNLETDLAVPYYSQNANPWGPAEYDHAISIGLSPITMDRWGCAVTSAAMVLNFHGITEFENGSPITPGTLNEWLKDNDGYQTSKPGYGNPFSKFDWTAIPRLTKELFPSKAPYKLIHRRQNNTSNKNEVLKEDLSDEDFPTPGILGVANSDTIMHFVVAKGFNDNTFFINDPEWNYPNLQSFSNDFFQLDRYIKSNTNFSYIEMSSSEGVEILVIDPEDRKTGKKVIGGVTNIYNEIPNAIYNYQNPISNPNSGGEKENFGFGFNEFLLPEPNNGRYRIVLSSIENQTYTFNIAALEEDGDDVNFQMTGIVGPGENDELSLDYSQDGPSTLDEIVTFDSLINDINALRASGDISNFGVYISLLSKAESAKFASFLSNETAKNILNAFSNELKAQKGKEISETAYNILKPQASILYRSL
jgi:hypothetical protein